MIGRALRSIWLDVRPFVRLVVALRRINTKGVKPADWDQLVEDWIAWTFDRGDMPRPTRTR